MQKGAIYILQEYVKDNGFYYYINNIFKNKERAIESCKYNIKFHVQWTTKMPIPYDIYIYINNIDKIEGKWKNYLNYTKEEWKKSYEIEVFYRDIPPNIKEWKMFEIWEYKWCAKTRCYNKNGLIFKEVSNTIDEIPPRLIKGEFKSTTISTTSKSNVYNTNKWYKMELNITDEPYNHHDSGVFKFFDNDEKAIEMAKQELSNYLLWLKNIPLPIPFNVFIKNYTFLGYECDENKCDGDCYEQYTCYKWRDYLGISKKKWGEMHSICRKNNFDKTLYITIWKLKWDGKRYIEDYIIFEDNAYADFQSYY
jgi:hypothetical protein